jgi:hypothetical protein
MNKLSNITIGNSVTTIGTAALTSFKYCCVSAGDQKIFTDDWKK